MDSLKMFKGYGKVEHHLEDHQQQQQQQQQRNPKSKPVFITAISILAILFLTLIFAVIHHNTNANTNTNTESQQLLNSAESIRFVCNVTRFPDACLAAIPPSPNATNPKAILLLSLRASIHALQNLTSSIPTPNSRALADCRDQLHDALSQLNDSLTATAAPMTEATVADVQTWVSAAATDQQTCLDGLEEVGDVAGADKMKKLMKRSNEYISNSLAIVANIPNLLRHFHMTLH